MKKISIIGAGNVGASTAQRLAELEIGNIVMVDIVTGLPQGKCLDLMQAAPIIGYDVNITGTNNYADIEESDIVIITAGVARKPGMSREDLLKINEKIIREICKNVKIYAPNSIIITVTNPLDIITHVVYKCFGSDRKKVFGMSGLLDATRFRYFISQEIGCSVNDVHSLVMGGHGDTMIPLVQYTTVSGIPITELLPLATIDKLVEKTIKGGAEIVNLLKDGSAFYAPAAAIAEMIRSILKDTGKILTASVYLQGEYGFQDVCLGVPVMLGKEGIKKIFELELTSDQKAALQRSKEAVTAEIEQLK